eukprot:3280718-Amphidinium_carterae.1
MIVISSNRGLGLEEKKQNGHTLRWAVETCKANRETVLSVVQPTDSALESSRRYNGAIYSKADREIVLTAVMQDGTCLQWAEEPCRIDSEIVLAAVKKDGMSLQWAAESCRSDREVMLAAIAKSKLALMHAAEELLEDSSFAAEAKQELFLFKVSLLSGCSTHVPVSVRNTFSLTEHIIRARCRRFGLEYSATMKLIHGSGDVPGVTPVRDFPGLKPGGK